MQGDRYIPWRGEFPISPRRGEDHGTLLGRRDKIYSMTIKKKEIARERCCVPLFFKKNLERRILLF
jgi:hypothetical protein